MYFDLYYFVITLKCYTWSLSGGGDLIGFETFFYKIGSSMRENGSEYQDKFSLLLSQVFNLPFLSLSQEEQRV
jgi:hypothetical protein